MIFTKRSQISLKLWKTTETHQQSTFLIFEDGSSKQKQIILKAAKDEEIQVLGFGRGGFCYGFSTPVTNLPKIDDRECLGFTLKFYLSKFLKKGDEEIKLSLHGSFIIALETCSRVGDILRSLRLPSGDAVVTFAEEDAWKDLKGRGKIMVQHQGNKLAVPSGLFWKVERSNMCDTRCKWWYLQGWRSRR
ncbi:unnamed protein product [Blepharisma stoltei]|uniref:Uncharacterized protein n=1 Tax=Blepharisma stoltei TaxID=1481888 RepID=A0AAU9KF71_9CILI|nr:unnamed protein product [Blepharisma stoltei]